MEMVIRWRKSYIPHSVFENIKTFMEASTLADQAVVEFGSPIDINLFEDHRHIASLKIVR